MKKAFRMILLIIVLIFSITIVANAARSPIIGDNYPQVYDLYWNSRTARWSVDGRANKYEIRLYRDGRMVY